jgi:hypothetical protein
MLNSILNKFVKKQTSNTTNIDLYDEEATNNKQRERTSTITNTNTKTKNKVSENLEDFLNENGNLSMKTKCDEVLKKYCNLYTDEEETDKFAIKPLNYKFLEQKNRRIEYANTTGDGWFNMKAQEITPEIREDLKAVQLRHIIDPGRFYKKMDRDILPKFFQIGTILDNIVDGKKNRLKKSEVKGRLAEEFLEEDKEKNYSLRKFEELQDARRKVGLKKTNLNKYKLKSKRNSKKSGFIVK